MSGRQAAARLCRLGFTSRQALLNYQDYGEEFLHTLQIARLRVECHYEQLLQDPACKPAAVIFALKRFGWRDNRPDARGQPANFAAGYLCDCWQG